MHCLLSGGRWSASGLVNDPSADEIEPVRVSCEPRLFEISFTARSKILGTGESGFSRPGTRPARTVAWIMAPFAPVHRHTRASDRRCSVENSEYHYVSRANAYPRALRVVVSLNRLSTPTRSCLVVRSTMCRQFAVQHMLSIPAHAQTS